MFGMKGKSKRRIAAFLAICMLVASLQGTAMATVTEGSPPDTTVFSLSTEKFREEAADAVIKGRRYDDSMEFFGGDTPAIAAEYLELLGGDNVFELERIPYENRASASDLPDGSGLRIFICADRTQLNGSGEESVDKASESELKTSGSRRRASVSELEESEPKASGSELKASDSEMRLSEYEVTGDEQIIFLFTNNTDHDLTFQLNMDGRTLQTIFVPSGETLGYGAASASEAEMDTADEEEAIEASETEESSLADELDELPLAKSSKEVSRVTAFEPKPSYDRDDPDAPKSPDEEFEMMGLDDDEEYEEIEEPAERSKVLDPVLIKEQPQNGLLRMFSRLRTQRASGTAVLYLTTLNAVEDTLEPKIGKAAWKDNDTQDEYDIVLQVTGDTVRGESSTAMGANVLFVLDSSTSMAGNNRWNLLKIAVNNSLKELNDKNKGNINVALFDYSKAANKEFQINGEKWNELNENTNKAIKNHLDNGIRMDSYTATNLAFNRAAEIFGDAPDGNNNYLILVTDGEPWNQGSNVTNSIPRALQAGFDLRTTYNTYNKKEKLSVYMVGVGPNITNDSWMNPEKEGTYADKYYHTQDGEMEALFSDLVSEIISTNVTNPFVTDELSDKVQPVNESGILGAPMMWLYDKTIDASDVNGVGMDGIKAKATKLFAKTSGDTVEYYLNEEDATKEPEVQYVAMYSNKTIKWPVADSLPKDTTKTLIYRVKAVGEVDESSYVSPGKDTGTHSIPSPSEGGYYSNNKALFTYTNENLEPVTMEFLHPVVRPHKAETGSIVITKKIEEGKDLDYYNKLEEKETFEFDVKLTNVTVDKISVPDDLYDKSRTPDNNNEIHLTFLLKHGESYRIEGLNKDARYEITENDYNNEPYDSKLSSLKVDGDVNRNEDEGFKIDIAGRKTTGTFSGGSGSGETSEVIYYRESISVDENSNEIVYGDPIKAETGQEYVSGWYKDKEFINEKEEFYEDITTIEKQNEPVKETLVWLYDGKEEIARADSGNRDEISAAQDQVVKWLSEKEYNIDVQKSNTDYSVTASKNELLSSLEAKGEKDRNGRITWERNRSPQAVEKSLRDQYPNQDIIITHGEDTGKRNKVNILYSAYLRTTIKVETTLIPASNRDYWEYNSTRYYDIKILRKIVENDGYDILNPDDPYKVTYGTKKSNWELHEKDGFRHRVYYTVTPQGQSSKIDVLFTNTFEMDGITVVKTLDIEPGAHVPDGEEYIFKVEKKDSTSPTGYRPLEEDEYEIEPVGLTTAVKTDDGFIKMTGEGKVVLLINDPNEKDSEFRITETGKGNADTVEWDGKEKGIIESRDVELRDEVTCTNHYTNNNTLTISKTLSAESINIPEAAEDAKRFLYEVTFTDKDGKTLKTIGCDELPDGVTIVNGEFSNENKTITLPEGEENNAFMFTIKAEASLTLNRIPTGASYKVKEIKIADGNLGDYYEYTISNITRNDKDDEAKPNPVEGEYTIEYPNAQSVIFENTLKAKLSNIVLKKQIVDEDGKELTTGDGETFIFKIENHDEKSAGYGNVFYAALKIKNGEATETLSVPYGQGYVVTEEDHLRYKVYVAPDDDTNGKITIETTAGKNVATIKNYLVSSGYFTDSKVTINEVGTGGFKQQSESGETRSMPPASALPPESVKEEDESSDES